MVFAHFGFLAGLIGLGVLFVTRTQVIKKKLLPDQAKRRYRIGYILLFIGGVSLMAICDDITSEYWY